MQVGKGDEVSGPNEVGTGLIYGEEIEFSRLIDILNDRFGTDFKPADQLFFDSIKEDAVADSPFRQAALANNMEHFGYVFLKAFEGLFIAAKYLNDKYFRTAVGKKLLKEVYGQINKEGREKTNS